MAKRKSRKKAKDVGKIALVVLFLFTACTIGMAFVANVRYLIGEEELFNFKGFDVVFGTKTEVIMLGEVEFSSFSFMAFLAYLLPIVGLITAILFNKSRLLSIVPLACFLISAILFFLMPELVIFSSRFINEYKDWDLAIGAIIAAIINIFSAITVVVKILLS